MEKYVWVLVAMEDGHVCNVRVFATENVAKQAMQSLRHSWSYEEDHCEIHDLFNGFEVKDKDHYREFIINMRPIHVELPEYWSGTEEKAI